MLRRSVFKSSRQLSSALILGRRSYAAPQGAKRALSKQQLEASTPPPAVVAPPPPPPPAGGGGGDNTPLLVGVGLLAVGGGALYYYQTQSPVAPVPVVTEETPAESPKEEEEASKVPEEEEKAVETITDEAAPLEESTPIPVEEATPEAVPESPPKVTLSTVSVEESLKELRSSIEQDTSEVLKRANQEVMRSFDESLFEGLDEMSPSQLKARVVQLATEMKDRTRWEALRLKEFLAMKEKETADKYLDVLQTQRLEFEGILQRRLLEQEHEMTTQTNAKLQEKDGAVKEMIDKAIEVLGEEHENEKKAMMERTEQEIKAQYEQMFGQKLEEIKTGVMDEMERKVQAMRAMNKKLQDLESALASTQGYHEGSLQAHRLSAAALALAEKMESNKGAAGELNALKAVAGNDNVIAAALSSLPASVTKGVPTLPELQARFDAVAKKTRQAALVPAGQSGLEGQIAGMLFATLKFPPKPDDPPPEGGSAAAEYIVVQAKKLVQFGDLENAVQQLDKLDGQAAYTVQAWKKDAADRVAVEQALKVIKMECALLNESMSNHP